jgi:hypothetical protein
VAAILINHRNAGAALAALDTTVDWLHRRAGHALTVVDHTRETRPAPAASVDVFPKKPEYTLNVDAVKDRNTAVIPPGGRREYGDAAPGLER